MKENQDPRSKNPLGLKRIFLAIGYSLDGLKHATSKEPAFQQELIFLGIMTFISVFTPFSIAFKISITISHLFILLVELLNSAIEAIVDKASPEYHILAKHSKDMASSAVFLSFLISIIVWGYAIYEIMH